MTSSTLVLFGGRIEDSNPISRLVRSWTAETGLDKLEIEPTFCRPEAPGVNDMPTDGAVLAAFICSALVFGVEGRCIGSKD